MPTHKKFIPQNMPKQNPQKQNLKIPHFVSQNFIAQTTNERRNSSKLSEVQDSEELVLLTKEEPAHIAETRLSKTQIFTKRLYDLVQPKYPGLPESPPQEFIEQLSNLVGTNESPHFMQQSLLNNSSDNLTTNEFAMRNSFTEDDGRLGLDKMVTLELSSKAAGWYGSKQFMLPSLQVVIKKDLVCSMNQYKPINGVAYQPEEYNALICPALAQQFNISSAQYMLAKDMDIQHHQSQNYILTPLFLKPNEELVHASTIEALATGKEETVVGTTRSISQMMEYLDKFLKDYRYEGGKSLPKETIDTVKLEYLEQRFFNRFIQNTDEHLHNFGIITNGADVHCAPMFDYDFTLSRKTSEFTENGRVPDWATGKEFMCDNGKTDITSFIEQYKDYPGFKKFALSVVENIDINKLKNSILQKNGIEFKSDAVTDATFNIIQTNIKEMQTACTKAFGAKEMQPSSDNEFSPKVKISFDELEVKHHEHTNVQLTPAKLKSVSPKREQTISPESPKRK